MSEHLRGHNSLADMVGTHITVWRKLLKDKLVNATSDADVSYYNHELNALADIETACSVEKENAKGLVWARPGRCKGVTINPFATEDHSLVIQLVEMAVGRVLTAEERAEAERILPDQLAGGQANAGTIIDDWRQSPALRVFAGDLARVMLPS